VDDDNSLLDSIVTLDEAGISSMIPKQKDKHGMALTKLSKTQNILIPNVKKQSDVGHILRQSQNPTQRICYARSNNEYEISCGSTVFFFFFQRISWPSPVPGKSSSYMTVRDFTLLY
jgi:hypothetical protein